MLYQTPQSWTREHLPKPEGLPTAERCQSSIHAPLSSPPRCGRHKRGEARAKATARFTPAHAQPSHRPGWPLAARSRGSSRAATDCSRGPAQQHARLLRTREAQRRLLPSSRSGSAGCWAVMEEEGCSAGAKCQQRGATRDLLRVSLNRRGIFQVPTSGGPGRQEYLRAF